MNVLAFDIEGDYAHYKKIYATTSAVSYAIPTKTSLYGYLWALACIEKSDDKNNYLRYFTDKQCLIGLGIRAPIRMQRININLRAKLGRMNPNDNRKPTMMEFVYQPRYRIYVWHRNTELYDSLKRHLESHTTVYTPTLGLAGLISNFSYKGEYEAWQRNERELVEVQSVIPKSKFIGFDSSTLINAGNEIIEQSMYPVEMDTSRNVTERDDILFDRTAKPISAYLTDYYQINSLGNVILF